MRSTKIMPLCLFLSLSANLYGELIPKQTSEILNYSVPQRDEMVQDQAKDLKRLKNRSFVISCGGGCAMTYTATEIKQNTSSFKVKFKVEMYVNEALTDNYAENYSFVYNALKTIDKILDSENKNVLEILPMGARRSFMEFGKDLMQTYGTGSDYKK